MPVEQYASDEPYPPFACGCGFVLSAVRKTSIMTTLTKQDLVKWLVERADTLPFCRLVDVAFGLYLAPLRSQITIMDEPRIRPYPAMPVFHPDTIVQHYL